MPIDMQAEPIFKLDASLRDQAGKKLFAFVARPVERLLLFDHLNKVYERVRAMPDHRPFAEKVLDALNVTYDLSEDDLSRLLLPRGPMIVIANHPFGGLEGIILCSLLRSIRCDVKFMANYLLAAIPEMREIIIPVDPFGRSGSVRSNFKPLRECIRWIRNNGMLVLFPAGAVSHLDLRSGMVTDPEWHASLGRLIRLTKAPVLPLFFEGSNSMLFHTAGLVHPLLRTALLPGELLNKKGVTVRIKAGSLIAPGKFSAFTTDREIVEYARLRTYVLAHRADGPPARRKRSPRTGDRERTDAPIASPQAPDILEQEISELPTGRRLAANGDLAAFLASANEAPAVLREIGRLREISFRAAGEGTGKPVDLDRFDEAYLHLFIWNSASREIAGAYRLGRTDCILPRDGVRGLYTSTLFAYSPRMIERLNPALELGRSFVRPEYQRSYAPLLLLWKGIGRYIVDHPEYRTLFGPVSISRDYQPLSMQFMVSFLEANRLDRSLSGRVKSRHPHRLRPVRGWNAGEAVKLVKDDVDDLSALIADIERDRKGVPVLLKQYLKLGGRILGFNRDPDFSNVLDALIVVDLAGTEPIILERYLGREGAASFLRSHHASGRHGDRA